MHSDPATLFQRFLKYRCLCPGVGMGLDISRMDFEDESLLVMEPSMQAAFKSMAELEAGAIANPDENRRVGHYWLRAPQLAPDPQIRGQIDQTVRAVETFAADIRAKNLVPPKAPRFTDFLLIGIGGSALGPQLVLDALGPARPGARGALVPHFLDNTDPDGFDRALAELGRRLKSTLVLVISKSGSTKETRNGMLEMQAAFTAAGLEFPRQFVAVTGAGSELDRQAQQQLWLSRFPMWDFVGGRTSVTSAVGLLPAALAGIDIRAFLDGAAAMDELTRQPQTRANPAALLALMWFKATDGTGKRDMVVLPYKDRLLLLSRYLQQLVMESLGKEKDLSGRTVRQGLAVYGNKGSTDQHAFVQQLREGLENFFVTFVVVLRDREAARARQAPHVDPQTTSGDYLTGFWQGTRQALAENGRQSMTLTLQRLDPRSLGAVIALFERAVGFYASLININAYHQPGVEAGKKAAAAVLELQGQVLDWLRRNPSPATALEIAQALSQPAQAETVYHILEHLAHNARGVKQSRDRFSCRAP